MALDPIKISPVPDHLRSDPVFYRWLQDVVRLFDAEGGISGEQVDLDLSDLGSRPHADLQEILSIDNGGGERHVTQAQWDKLEADIANLQSSLSPLTARVVALEILTATHTAQILALQVEQAQQRIELDDHETRITALEP